MAQRLATVELRFLGQGRARIGFGKGLKEVSGAAKVTLGEHRLSPIKVAFLANRQFGARILRRRQGWRHTSGRTRRAATQGFDHWHIARIAAFGLLANAKLHIGNPRGAITGDTGDFLLDLFGFAGQTRQRSLDGIQPLQGVTARRARLRSPCRNQL